MIYVSIGNSDDKLEQARWADLWRQINLLIRNYAARIHGTWLSEPSSVYQNACWAFEIEPDRAKLLRAALRRLAGTYGQDSIAWAIVEQTEFLTGEEKP